MEIEPHDQKLMNIQITEVMIQAIDRREEVFRATEATETDDEACEAVAALLGVGEIRAPAVLDMQARRWTLGHRRRLVGQLEQVRADLETR